MAANLERIVVLGVGSELRGDDAAGILVAQRLAAMDLPANVEVVEGHTGGINLLFDIEDANWAIVVDAVDFGGKPGEVVVFEAEDADLFLVQRVASLHHVSLADVLEIGRQTGLAARVTIVGLQPQDIGFGRELSEAVAASLGDAVGAIVALLSAPQQAAGDGPSPASGGGTCQEGVK